jgi:hypothetical protein
LQIKLSTSLLGGISKLKTPVASHSASPFSLTFLLEKRNDDLSASATSHNSKTAANAVRINPDIEQMTDLPPTVSSGAHAVKLGRGPLTQIWIDGREAAEARGRDEAVFPPGSKALARMLRDAVVNPVDFKAPKPPPPHKAS